MKSRWRLVTIGSGILAVFTLGVGLYQFFCRKGAGAEWLTAAGGFALIAFASVQLDIENTKESDRRAAARARLKPVARLARRGCEQGIIQSDGKPLNQWLGHWYSPKDPQNHPIDKLQALMRETVTLAAEAGGEDVKAADAAFDAFIAAADIMNDMSKTLLGAQEEGALRAASPRGKLAVAKLVEAARELQKLAPRTEQEPPVPANPKFQYEA
jgi:hypothetical protein